ncbi:MAG: SpoIIE family protein phosphatase [Spirochaetales bacterium]|nr:SpoIIE family protein phosphatase [Spirochaetales bacterium]
MRWDYDYAYIGSPSSFGACGDLCFAEEAEQDLFLGIVDGVGTGVIARDIALRARDYVLGHCRSTPLDRVMEGLNQSLRETRGAVAVLGKVDLSSGRLQLCGIGNIKVKYFGTREETILLQEGIIGYSIPPPKVTELELEERQLVIMASDGVNLTEFSRKTALSGKERMDRLVRSVLNFQYAGDDASCFVLRYAP